MRTVYLGTSEFAAEVLARLALSPHRPQLVVTRPDRPAGRGRKVSLRRWPRPPGGSGSRRRNPRDVNGAEARAAIAAVEPEVVCICAYGALIKEPLLSEHDLLNVHPSLLAALARRRPDRAGDRGG